MNPIIGTNVQVNGSIVSVSIVTFDSDIEMLSTTILNLMDEIGNIETTSNFTLSQLIIIDNYSNPSYRLRLKEYIHRFREDNPQHTIEAIYLEKNIGFGKAHNIAISKIDSDFHFILNPDLTIKPRSLAYAVGKFTIDKDLALVAPIITDERGRPTRSHYNELTAFGIFLRSVAPAFLTPIFKNNITRMSNVPINRLIDRGSNMVFSGCAMLCNTKYLKAVGGFSGNYFLYFEDYDLSLKLLRHYKAIVDPNFEVVHSGGNSSKKGIRHWVYFLRSAIQFFVISPWKKR